MAHASWPMPAWLTPHGSWWLMARSSWFVPSWSMSHETHYYKKHAVLKEPGLFKMKTTNTREPTLFKKQLHADTNEYTTQVTLTCVFS